VNHNNLGNTLVLRWWTTTIWGASACSTGDLQQSGEHARAALV